MAFGLYLWYLAYSNGSFPAKERPFSNYASVVSSSFNGTEFAFQVRWTNSHYIPLKAQLNSPSSDSANSPPCSTGLTSVQNGQVIFLPFAISPPSAVLTNVDLYVDVRSSTNSTEFTIVYNTASISAGNAPITPSNISCQQPAGSM